MALFNSGHPMDRRGRAFFMFGAPLNNIKGTIMQESSEGRSVILLVEDNLGDARLIVELLNSGKSRHDIRHVDDGVKAQAYLRKEGDYVGTPQPHLVLLDLNLPRKNGREVLAEAKTDPSLKHIPVIILTTSEAERDILQCYELHANGYLTKPADFDDFYEAMQVLDELWLDTACLPLPAGRPLPEEI